MNNKDKEYVVILRPKNGNILDGTKAIYAKDEKMAITISKMFSKKDFYFEKIELRSFNYPERLIPMEELRD